MAFQVFVKARTRHLGEPSGDAFWYAEEGSRLWLLVVDGLGSGVEAARPAAEAVRCVRSHLEKEPHPPDVEGCLRDILVACDRALHGTRGAALGLASFDAAAGQGYFGGVGNVEMRVLGRQPAHPVAVSGIVGSGLRKVRVEPFVYLAGDLIVMHSDGLSSRFTVAEEAVLAWHVAAVGERLVADWGKSNDDLTVVLVRQHAA